MGQTVRGVVSQRKGAPVELVDIIVPDPGPSEVVVEVIACALCHSDLTYREGGVDDQYPFLLGHEAAGVVETAGERVTHVAPGDFVMLNWRSVCGQCRACMRGAPAAVPRQVHHRTADDAGRRHRTDPCAGRRGARRKGPGA